MTHDTTRSLPLPAVGTVHALDAFIQARLEESVQILLERIPTDQRETPDAVELLRLPRALGQSAHAAAQELERHLLAGQPEETPIHLLWNLLLNIARPYQDRSRPASVREALAAADEAQP
ncbi:hypothetical protein P3T27_007504 [Kitasatospora sp. MAA19]|uniref:hypothetical protein n=1 Tax=unclassified Kitasatospora TaxID=2633591 RepID=UPI002476B71A|nr:hypothetical protein [Kitasatospora sp. MAA19]MDH6710753.1 hypothetical protein [Kitasatospora sp. MAA19]